MCTMAVKLRFLVEILLSLGWYRAEFDDKQQSPFWAGKLWAQYSPYAPVGKYEAPNRGCDITQVNIVRNGSSSC